MFLDSKIKMMLGFSRFDERHLENIFCKKYEIYSDEISSNEIESLIEKEDAELVAIFGSHWRTYTRKRKPYKVWFLPAFNVYIKDYGINEQTSKREFSQELPPPPNQFKVFLNNNEPDRFKQFINHPFYLPILLHWLHVIKDKDLSEYKYIFSYINHLSWDGLPFVDLENDPRNLHIHPF